MALTGIEIFKLLPKTNCGQCGVPTCLAFAMALAAGKTELARCPHVSEEARAKLSEAAAPPILTVTIGTGEHALKLGGETVLFRHEKRFENPPGIAILISDTMPEAEIDARLRKAAEMSYERVGLTLRANLVALKGETGSPEKLAALAAKAKQAAGNLNIILMSERPEVLGAALRACAEKKPLLYAATKDNIDAMISLAKEASLPLAVKGDDLEGLASLTEKVASAGLKQIVIDPGARKTARSFQEQVIIRSSAITKKFRPLGYPTIVFPCEMTDDPMKEAMLAAMFLVKYAGIIVLSDYRGESLFPLLVARLNIYTDPQRPLATKQGIYEINNPGADSPLLVTSNFSLTYFIVSGEIENSRVPGYLFVKDTEGLSVMTAWAAGKFSADTIAPAILKSGITEKIRHRRLIIPGYVAAEKGALEEQMPGWEIVVGPRDAADLPAFLKTWKS
ncbi:MAG: acetyl-CoA decarbonylase/synthase complex subunit gamma [Dehalococcoidales bacterium]|nr:acetyl-CoA decarbonylase/synthase complex subunit gamma [Dehalococcoidales bacterium]